MRKTGVWITMGCCLFAVAIFAWAQANRKPGLWEMTTNMTWQQSPMPSGMTMPGGGPRTTQMCLTQEMLDKYGAPMPQSHGNECKATNVVMKSNSMTADWICTGAMAGKGTVESSWTDPDHSRTKIHFVGNMQMGPSPKTIEYTMDSTSIYKGADCGSVKPMAMPK